MVLWTAAVILTVAAACLRPDALLPTARATLGPFATLAAIIAGSVLAGRLGVFGALARFLIRDQAPRAVAAVSVLAFTALLSGLVNLDVAVVVAMPVALEAARRHCMSAGRLAVAVAITANAASFLLPTSNITSLLLLGRTSLPAAGLPARLVAGVATGCRGYRRVAVRMAGPGRNRPGSRAQRQAVRAVPRSTWSPCSPRPPRSAPSSPQASRCAAAWPPSSSPAQRWPAWLNNLPAAAALRPAGTAGLWAAILATAIGPGLLLTGSVATLICRRIARDAGAALRAWQFTAIGSVLVPAQLAAAVIGLHLDRRAALTRPARCPLRDRPARRDP